MHAVSRLLYDAARKGLPTLAAILAACAAAGSASQTSAPAATSPTITVTARLVYVDVVVRDTYGRAILNLTKNDFSVKEDGRPQQIAYFQDNSTRTATKASPSQPTVTPPQTGSASDAPTEFSNVTPSASADPSANIILLDLLDTPATDQLYALKQLMLFLKKLPPGHQVALFLLSDKLHMLQGFTGSSEQLSAAASRLSASDLGRVRSESDRMQELDIVTSFAKAMGHDPGGFVASRIAEMNDEDTQNLVQRAATTSDAFAQIARAASGYPGRKNLLWLAESFPVGMAAQLQVDRSPDVGGDLLGNTNMIANLGIAIYPISLAGLVTEGIPAAAGGAAEVSLIGGPPMGNTLNPQAGDTLSSQFIARNSMYYAMNDIARASGGEAFHGTNDIAGALARSVDDGSHFYTLAFRSTDNKWDGQYRHIKVSLALKGYQLSYRRGYFATPQPQGSRGVDAELNAALQPGMLDSSLLRLRASILAAPNRPAVAVHATLNASDLTYTTDATGHRHTQLLVTLVALAQANSPKPVAQTSSVLNVDLDPPQYAALLKNGLQFRQQIALKPGDYHLHLGVAETNTHRIGTLDMPLSIGAASPAISRKSAP